MVVKRNAVVSLRYVMKNDAGEILEDIRDQEPIEYLHGGGQISAQLEKNLEGLRAGDQRAISLNAGGSRGTFHFEVIIDCLRMADPEEIASGSPRKKTDSDCCGPDCCC